jgi:hypothetical protein
VAFLIWEAIIMELNEDLRAMGIILEQKEEIKNNPFKNIPVQSLAKALELLEEYSEEISIKP